MANTDEHSTCNPLMIHCWKSIYKRVVGSHKKNYTQNLSTQWDPDPESSTSCAKKSLDRCTQVIKIVSLKIQRLKALMSWDMSDMSLHWPWYKMQKNLLYGMTDCHKFWVCSAKPPLWLQTRWNDVEKSRLLSAVWMNTHTASLTLPDNSG